VAPGRTAGNRQGGRNPEAAPAVNQNVGQTGKRQYNRVCRNRNKPKPSMLLGRTQRNKGAVSGKEGSKYVCSELGKGRKAKEACGVLT